MTATPTPDFQEETVQKKKISKVKKALVVISIVLAFILAFVSAFFIVIKIGENKLRESLVSAEKETSTEESMDDNAVYLDGKAYYYNKDLINLLFLGVDESQETKTEQGQADAIYLFSVDTKKNKVKILSVSRNTLCEVDVLNSDGVAYGTENQPICLSFAYGKDNINSSENTANAVSKLLYNLPINGYYTLHLNSISKIVNSVGGVKVSIPNDVPDVFADRIGKTVTLKGDEALAYLQMRGDSNAPRVERHKTFIKSFVNSAKTAVKKDISLPFDLAKDLSREATTNIDVSSVIYLATEALNWQLDFVNIKGEYAVTEKYEVFKADEQALKELVISNFYTEK